MLPLTSQSNQGIKEFNNLSGPPTSKTLGHPVVPVKTSIDETNIKVEVTEPRSTRSDSDSSINSDSSTSYTEIFRNLDSCTESVYQRHHEEYKSGKTDIMPIWVSKDRYLQTIDWSDDVFYPNLFAKLRTMDEKVHNINMDYYKKGKMTSKPVRSFSLDAIKNDSLFQSSSKREIKAEIPEIPSIKIEADMEDNIHPTGEHKPTIAINNGEQDDSFSLDGVFQDKEGEIIPGRKYKLYYKHLYGPNLRFKEE